MFPGLNLVLECPHCAASVSLPIMDDPTGHGMVTWTDGWQTTPGVERPPRISRCPGCGRTFWVAEARQRGFATEAEGTLPELVPLDAAGTRQALAEGLGALPELELELRVWLWWRDNDPFREPANLGHAVSPEAVENMARLIAMTDQGDEDLLLFRAEAQRQLGRFADATETLKGVGCSDYAPAKNRQVELLAAGSRDLDLLFVPLAAETAPEA